MTNNAELKAFIAGGESDCVEFTETIRDMDKLRKAICAFANDLPNHGAPGFLFIGIKDDGTCAGTVIDNKFLATVAGLQNDGKIHPFPSMTVSKRTLDGCDIAVVQVEPSDNPPVRVDGRCWTRTGPRRAQATAEDERRLTEKRHWGDVKYDMQGVAGATVENDIDMGFFEKEYLPNAVSREVLAENNRDRDDQLRSLRFVTQDDTPTVTAILMLGETTSFWFPGAYIQFIRFAGDEFDSDHIESNKEIHGSLPDQLRKMDEILDANISVALGSDGTKHVQQPDYPFVALREIYRNAVIHRNYDGSNTPVRIHWYSDRVEIISPSSVYGRVTNDNLGTPGITDYRNPTIAEIMKNMGYMEKFGSGIDTANRALLRNGNPIVQFDFQDTFITATIKK